MILPQREPCCGRFDGGISARIGSGKATKAMRYRATLGSMAKAHLVLRVWYAVCRIAATSTPAIRPGATARISQPRLGWPAHCWRSGSPQVDLSSRRSAGVSTRIDTPRSQLSTGTTSNCLQLGRRYDCRIAVRAALMLAISSYVFGFKSGW